MMRANKREPYKDWTNIDIEQIFQIRSAPFQTKDQKGILSYYHFQLWMDGRKVIKIPNHSSFIIPFSWDFDMFFCDYEPVGIMVKGTLRFFYRRPRNLANCGVFKPGRLVVGGKPILSKRRKAEITPSTFFLRSREGCVKNIKVWTPPHLVWHFLQAHFLPQFFFRK